jgi:hypothetical protein
VCKLGVFLKRRALNGEFSSFASLLGKMRMMGFEKIV